MSIERFFTTEFTIYRQVYVGNKSSQSSVGTFSGHVQQRSPMPDEFLDNSFTDSFFIWCPSTTDIRKGDRIDGGGKSYSVQQIQEEMVGKNKHLQLICQRLEGDL